MDTTGRARKINALLAKAYPDAKCTLVHKTPLQLLVATILSAQCTDVRVNKVTPALFKKYPNVAALAKAPLPQLEQEVRTTGFYRQKARSIQKTAGELVKRFGGKVPRTLEELVTLPGVWRKTANVILGVCYGVPGIVVDTHVRRLAYRMGLTNHTDPDKIEKDLMALLLRKEWTPFSHRMIFHGRRICAAVKPACPTCPVLRLCPRWGLPPL
ncbi:MAG: endonuclease III [Candidatus Omnitrophica bacterium]|nr:endonuclease III [Candidatus Omnitrophota bacterium]